MIEALVKRARLQAIEARNTDLTTLREMLTRNYRPPNGSILPPFRPGTARHAAFERALRITDTSIPVTLNKTLGGLDFESTTWSDTKRKSELVDDLLGALNLPDLARRIAEEYALAGAVAVMASLPTHNGTIGEPTITLLRGVNVPYTSPVNPDEITGWYRALQYVDEKAQGRLRWYVDAIEFHPDGSSTHRVWESLESPTNLATRPTTEFHSAARPRFAVHTLQPDGLPSSQVLANMGKILALYATELRLNTVEELASFPMLLTKGAVEMEQVGPAEVIAVDEGGDASWLNPGSLEELRQQVALKKTDLREALSLPGGSLGSQTPSGEALQEANRSFMQMAARLAGVVSSVLTQVTNDYLALRGVTEPVDVQVPLDRAYLTRSLLEVVEKGLDHQAVPTSVAARMFQLFLGKHYSDDELAAFLEEREARENIHSFLTRQGDEA